MGIIKVRAHGTNDHFEEFSPSEHSWGLQDVSDSNAGRTQDALMHKNRIAQKRKIALGWNNPDAKEVSRVLTAFNPEYVDVRYQDAMSGEEEERVFYVGDRSAPMSWWVVGHKKYSKLSFDIVER